MQKYSDLSLLPPLQKALAEMNYETPTDVQAKTIPLVLEGRDVLVTAQTGTGKTAAFGVPLLQKVLEAAEENPDGPFPRVLVVAPTRELAEQIGQVFRELTAFARRFRYAVVIGGSPYPKQLRELKQDPAFVIGTPGRLIDHIETSVLKLDRFETLVLDEADRMLDMGFAPQMEQIVKAMPAKRQTLMFSATLPEEVRALVASYLKKPARVEIGEVNRPVDRIEQDVIELREPEKSDRLIEEIDKIAGTIIVFTKTKVKAEKVARLLRDIGHEADALHGDLTQGARRRVTNKFRSEEIRILVATDIAARGLDINHIAHVINYDVPMVEEDYVHRIGRTARAGREGHSIIFVTPTERIRWAKIQRLMGIKTPYVSKAQTRGEEMSKRPFGKKSDNAKPTGSRPSGKADRNTGSRPSGKTDRASMGAGPRAGGAKAPRAPGYNSEEARAIRAEFEARLAAAEKGLGYDPRKAAEARARGEDANRRIEGGARPGGKKPWRPNRPQGGPEGAYGAQASRPATRPGSRPASRPGSRDENSSFRSGSGNSSFKGKPQRGFKKRR